MSYQVVGTQFCRLHRFEKELLYLDLLERPAFVSESTWRARFHAWLEQQVHAGRRLGEIVRSADLPRPDDTTQRAADPWTLLDSHVMWLIDRGLARGVRIVYVA